MPCMEKTGNCIVDYSGYSCTENMAFTSRCTDGNKPDKSLLAQLLNTRDSYLSQELFGSVFVSICKWYWHWDYTFSELSNYHYCWSRRFCLKRKQVMFSSCLAEQGFVLSCRLCTFRSGTILSSYCLPLTFWIWKPNLLQLIWLVDSH